MIKLGTFNTLTVSRSTSFGIFLEDQDGTEILIPNKYVPENVEQGKELEVFCYLDHKERPIATTLKPYVERDGFAFLQVADTNRIGAFMDWGLEKQLLVPFKEQQIPMQKGQSYVVHCFMDEHSERLTGSARLDRFLNNKQHDLEAKQEVDLLVYRQSQLGWQVIINQAYLGLVFHSDVFKPIKVGDQMKGYVKNIRDDHKIDVVLEPEGRMMMDKTSQAIKDSLERQGGFLPLHDKSSPEAIRNELGISKKVFKKSVGNLLKRRLIRLLPNGIELVEK